MPIAISCTHCDWKGTVKDELAGRKGKCPTCGEPITVPQASPPDVEDAAAAALLEADDDRPPPPPPVYVPPAATPYATERPEPRPADPPPRRKGPQLEFRAKERDTGRRGIAVSGGVLAGLAMMGGAALWFFLGLAANRIFFYPPVLFVLGLVQLVRSLAGKD